MKHRCCRQKENSLTLNIEFLLNISRMVQEIIFDGFQTKTQYFIYYHYINKKFDQIKKKLKTKKSKIKSSNL